MKLLGALTVIALAVTVARADDTPTPPDDATMVRIRELSEKHDYEGMRRELLGAYATSKHPALLFALGQVEYNLRGWQAAIDYYEQFIATNPPEEQVSLARQGIVAARIEMQRDKDKPPVLPPPKPRRREWYRSDTILVASGGAAVVLGTAAFFYGRHLGNDHSDSLAVYDERTDRARLYQWTGGGLAIAGAITAGVVVLRWRLRPDDGEVQITATGNGAQVSGTW